MEQSGYYSIGIDSAKNGDYGAVTVFCKDCNTVLLSKLFETSAVLDVPKQCPYCKAHE